MSEEAAKQLGYAATRVAGLAASCFLFIHGHPIPAGWLIAAVIFC